MDRKRSILDGLGEEIVRIVSPVSICMLMVVVLVSILNNDSDSDSSSSITSIATLIYNEHSSDSDLQKFEGALLNALVFVGVITVVTFLLVCLFYYRCTAFLRFYMGFAAFIVLAYMGGGVALLLVQALSIPIDCITFGILLFNFSVVGVLSVFGGNIPVVFTQGFLVLIGVLVAYWFTMLPEWTTWVLLVAMAIYDVVAVLIPGGPLRILVELAISRDEEIPALIYEARPLTTTTAPHLGPRPRPRTPPTEDPMPPSSTERGDHSQRQRVIWKKPRASGFTLWKCLKSGAEETNSASASASASVQNLSAVIPEEEGYLQQSTVEEESSPLINYKLGSTSSMHVDQQVGSSPLPELESLLDHTDGERRLNLIPQFNGLVEPADRSESENEGMSLSTSGAIKLGLGDFIFYSVMVGRAAMYDYMTVYACYLAIIAGLGVTLILLAFFQKALPALPVSISLGVVFYFLTRLLMEAFVVQITIHLLHF